MVQTSKPERLTLFPTVVRTSPESDSEGERVAAELGRLKVPERRADPTSKLIEIAFIRLKSTTADPGPPLIFLSGGPGIPGTDALRWGRAIFAWLMALREIGDVILLDQRGTGLSQPCLECLESWDLPLDQPGSRAETLRIAHIRMRQSAAFWRAQGVDLAGYTTLESADDIDDLRAALGYEQVHLYGASYGSHLALAMIRRHEPRVARAIMALVEGPDHTIKLPSNVQRHLEDLRDLALADPALKQAIPDLLVLMREVLERLEREPVTVETPDPQSGGTVRICLGKFDAQWVTARGLGMRGFIAKLPVRYYALAQGDYSWLAAEVLALRHGWIGNAMSYLMDCASGLSPERAVRIRREAPQTLLEDLIDFPFPEICTAWDAPDLGDDFRGPLLAHLPLLLLAGTLDGRTPPSNIEELRPDLSYSHRILMEGGTHSTGQLVANKRVVELMLAFLRGEELQDERVTSPFSFAPLERHR